MANLQPSFLSMISLASCFIDGFISLCDIFVLLAIIFITHSKRAVNSTYDEITKDPSASSFSFLTTALQSATYFLLLSFSPFTSKECQKIRATPSQE